LASATSFVTFGGTSITPSVIDDYGHNALCDCVL
jgi:hypothetical protein